MGSGSTNPVAVVRAVGAQSGRALRSFPVLVMVAAYSRFINAVMVSARIIGDLLAGMWLLLAGQVGRAPQILL